MSDLFVTRIKARKSALNLTMKQVSERAGVPQPTVEMYFYGQALPTFPRLVALCRALECSLDYIAGLADEPRPVKARRT